MQQQTIRALLPEDFPWRTSVFCRDVVDSTNTRVRELAANNAPHGTVLIANRQSAGRGRMGRSFASPEGMGVYLSVLLRPDCPAMELMHLTCEVGVAMCDAVEQVAGFRPGLKWANDLVTQRRKLAGILTEACIHPESGKMDAMIIGIGINCRQMQSDFPPELRDSAISLQMAAGREISCDRMAAAMVTALCGMDRDLISQRKATMQRYRRDCITIGESVCLLQGDRKRYARATDVDDWGALVVEFPDGHTETIRSGEASVRGMYGYV